MQLRLDLISHTTPMTNETLHVHGLDAQHSMIPFGSRTRQFDPIFTIGGNLQHHNIAVALGRQSLDSLSLPGQQSIGIPTGIQNARQAPRQRGV